MLITATILAGDTIVENGSVLVDASGKIVALGCDLPATADTTVLECPGAIVTPGFVNPHDHIYYNYVGPSAPPTEPSPPAMDIHLAADNLDRILWRLARMGCWLLMQKT